MAEPTVIARNLGYRVSDDIIIANVDVEISPGELVAIIGPNGAGKSTLFSLLAGSIRPTEGEVRLSGIDVSRAAPQELALARSILTQREPIDIPYTAAQVVHMGRFAHRHSPRNTSERDNQMVMAAMEQTDTTHLAGRVFSTLSKGEQTRVSLARVLAQETPVVLLDEPTAALDVAYQERVIRHTVQLAHDGRTVIVVLHDLNVAAVHADRVIMMKDGAVVAQGGPREVLESALLSTVYGQSMVVMDHPFRACPLVLIGEDPPPQ